MRFHINEEQLGRLRRKSICLCGIGIHRSGKRSNLCVHYILIQIYPTTIFICLYLSYFTLTVITNMLECTNYCGVPKGSVFLESTKVNATPNVQILFLKSLSKPPHQNWPHPCFFERTTVGEKNDTHWVK